MRSRRRPSTRSARHCVAAARAASTANTSGTARCRPIVTGASTDAPPATTVQLSIASAVTASHAAMCNGRSRKSSSNSACANTQNNTALPTDTATKGDCQSHGTLASNMGVDPTTWTHSPSASSTPARATGGRGRSRPKTSASTSSRASSTPRRAASSKVGRAGVTARERSGRAEAEEGRLSFNRRWWCCRFRGGSGSVRQPPAAFAAGPPLAEAP